MMTIPTYDIICDECGASATFPLAATPFRNLYEIRAPDLVYAHFGGETVEGKHRCGTCRKAEPPEPGEITDRVNAIRTTPSVGAQIERVVKRAMIYRRAEQDGTPRLWRGKDLHDKGLVLDEALEGIVDGGPEVAAQPAP